MTPDDQAAPDGPLDQDDLGTLQAELREAIQHHRAAVQRMQETQAELQGLLQRARTLLGGKDREPGQSGPR